MRLVEVEPGPLPSRVGVVVSSFNAAITDALLEGALKRLEREGVAEVTVMKVPGALELPVAAYRLIKDGCQAVVAVGAVIKGETDHYEIVAHESARGLTEVSIRTGCPVANAVLAVHDYEQALERAAPGPGNKGAEAAATAVLMARCLGSLSGLED